MLLSQAPNDPQNINVVTTDPNFTPLQGIFPSQYLKTGLNVLLGIVGVASFVFLIWGGLQFISSSGDKDALEKAKKRIVFALFGLIIAFSSYVAIYAVRALFNVNLVEFHLLPLGSQESYEAPPIPTLSVPQCGPCLCLSQYAHLTEIALREDGRCYQCQCDGWHLLPIGTVCSTITCSCSNVYVCQ
jgi:hypothetical protein